MCGAKVGGLQLLGRTVVEISGMGFRLGKERIDGVVVLRNGMELVLGGTTCKFL